ncbi:MAG: hypothetical protein R2743_14755 [Ilumatobacteraceae bacterium]
MEATCSVNPGVVTTADHSSTSARPTAMPTTAVTSGRPIATTEPNAISRITTAASSPNPSEAGITNSWNQKLEKSTSVPVARRPSAASAISATTVSAPASTSKFTSAVATVPSAERWPSVSGDVTANTPGIERTSARKSSIAGPAASMPRLSSNTMSAEPSGSSGKCSV